MTARLVPDRISPSDRAAELLRDAIEREYAAFERGMWAHARRAFPHLHEKELAGVVDDAVSDSVHRVLRAAARFDVNRPVLPWLFAFAINVLLEKRRARRRRREDTETDLEVDLDGAFAAATVRNDEGKHAAVHAILAQLPEYQSQILRLFYFDGLDGSALAERLGISEGAVRLRLYRARHRFARLWKDARIDR